MQMPFGLYWFIDLNKKYHSKKHESFLLLWFSFSSSKSLFKDPWSELQNNVLAEDTMGLKCYNTVYVEWRKLPRVHIFQIKSDLQNFPPNYIWKIRPPERTLPESYTVSPNILLALGFKKMASQWILDPQPVFSFFFFFPPVCLIEVTSTTINISKSGFLACKRSVGCYTLHLKNM